MTLRIATVQAEARPGDIASNALRAADFVTRARAERADLVVFPETFLTGYDTGVFAGPLPHIDDPEPFAPIQRSVDRAGTVVIVNCALDHAGHRSLTDVLVIPNRPLIAAYAKQHLYASERALFSPGTRGFTFTLKGVRIALSVCYDANFPEHAAAAAAAGADVYVNSGAYFPGGEQRRDLHYAARALDNGIYVVFSGLVGAPHDFIGGSAVFDPLGTRIARVDDREGLVVVDIDPFAIASARQQQTMWNDRRSDLGPYAHTGEILTLT
ncbi:carbon-nitrogen hydrolase family protein [Microbacterium sp. HMWF026]|nr:carbon-nitrogen hydrolase family protein [Microbacterium sp. HMWF026]